MKFLQYPLYTCLFFIIASHSVQGQNDFTPWQILAEDSTATLFDLQQSFEREWAGKTPEKGQGYMQFKRFENYALPRVAPSGKLGQLGTTYEEWRKYEKQHTVQAKSGNVWKTVGPASVPTNGGGAGRLTFVRFHPNNSSIMWTGTPNGGLWKTTNGGASWTNSNDFLSVIGCSDLLIHPTGPDTMYLATGDNDHYSSYSIGVLKSVDGGLTWNSTGLSFPTTSQIRIYKMEMDPTNSNVIVAVTTSGIRRTTDGGATWTSELAGSFRDLEFAPNNSNIVYAVNTTSFRKSTDNGDNWTQINAGLPTTNISRIAIGVSPDADSVVYLLYGASDNSLKGVYKSTDFGNSFVQVVGGSINMLGHNEDGSSSGGQAWYDLALAVNPTDENELWIGGVNAWKSSDGGVNWTIKTHWYGANGVTYVHADIHDIKYLPNSNELLILQDGGMAVSSFGGDDFTDISGNLSISQQYKIAQAANDPDILLAGHQDNGTNRFLGNGNWSRVRGGDGMDCAIDWSDNNVMYASYQYGAHARSTNGGSSFTDILNGLGDGLWVSPIHQHPTLANTIFIGGRSDLIKSTNRGTSYTALPTGGSVEIVEFAISKSQPDVMYLVTGTTGSSAKVLKTINGGQSFTDVTNGLPNSRSKTNVAIDPANPDHAWITYSGYTSTAKVYATTNGGQSWTNISSGLPNVPCNTLLVQDGTKQNLYLGTDVGVFYRDSLTNTWTLFGDSLPTVTVMDLEFYYPTNTLVAGTYGRGTWKVTAMNASEYSPVANFTQSNSEVCDGTLVSYSDASTNNPTSYSWSFPGGTPATSNAANPSITYNTPGTYDVTLTVTNSSGTNTKNLTNAITVNNCAGLDENELQLVKVYPNPATKEVSISSPVKIQSVVLMDATGRAVQVVLTDESKALYKVRWSQVGAGSYVLKIQTEKGLVLRPIQIL